MDGPTTAIGVSFDQFPRYLLRDRDKVFGDDFCRQVADMKIQEVLSAPRSSWQRAYVERVIGSVRRVCLDPDRLQRRLSAPNAVFVFSHYHETRSHLSLAKDCPEARPVQWPDLRRVVAIAQVGRLHHRYERRAV